MGVNSTNDRCLPTLVDFLLDYKIVEIYCESSLSFALTDQKVLFAWGDNANVQLGDFRSNFKILPQRICNFTKRYTELSTFGFKHSIMEQLVLMFSKMTALRQTDVFV